MILQRRVRDCLHSLELERWLDAISAMVRAALCRPWVCGPELGWVFPKMHSLDFFCRASTTDHSHSRQHLRFSPCCPGTHYASPWFSLCGLFRLPGIPSLACLSEPRPWLQLAVGLLCRLPPTQLSRGRFTCGSTSAPWAQDRRADPPCLPHACPPREARLLCAPVTVSPPRRAVLFSHVCVCVPRHGVLCTLPHGASSLLGLHLVLSLFPKDNLSKAIVVRYLISVTRLLQKGRVDCPGSVGCVRAVIPLLCRPQEPPIPMSQS